MKTVKVYKDNLREHIFRTLFFTDTVLFLGSGILVAISIFLLYRYIFHINQWGFIVSTIFLVELFYAIVATLKIDHQPLYKIIPRAIEFNISKKQFTMNQIGKTAGDFKISGNYVIRRKRLIGIYEIRPFDIALLNDEERERYYHHIKTMLHTLPGKVQLISRKNTATISDYHDHFYSLYESSHEKLNWLIYKYITDLSSLIEKNNFQLMKYYAIFSTPLASEGDTQFIEATKKLEDMVMRFSSALASERIHTFQLTNDQLVSYFQTQFRNI